jgi:hypothetical protein
MREKSLDDVDKTHQIYPDHPVPITRRDEFQRSAATDTCIAADDVYLFENSQRFRCSALHRSAVSDVTFDTMRVDPSPLSSATAKLRAPTSTSANITRMFARPQARAKANPRPLAPPVMNATLPRNSRIAFPMTARLANYRFLP